MHKRRGVWLKVQQFLVAALEKKGYYILKKTIENKKLQQLGGHPNKKFKKSDLNKKYPIFLLKKKDFYQPWCNVRRIAA